MAKVVKKQESSKFEINKPYAWEPDDIFEITGQQFALLYHALTQEINNAGGASIAQKYQAYLVMMEIFEDGVKQGVIKEKEEPKRIDPQTEGEVVNLFK